MEHYCISNLFYHKSIVYRDPCVSLNCVLFIVFWWNFVNTSSLIVSYVTIAIFHSHRFWMLLKSSLVQILVYHIKIYSQYLMEVWGTQLIIHPVCQGSIFHEGLLATPVTRLINLSRGLHISASTQYLSRLIKEESSPVMPFY